MTTISMRISPWILLLLAFMSGIWVSCAKKSGNGTMEDEGLEVLVFSKTGAFRHESIGPGSVSFKEYFEKKGIHATQSEDASLFTDTGLKQYDVILFFLTTGNILDSMQEAALMKFVGSGKGFVGIHSAADTEYDFPWFGELVGARFASHPDIQEAVFVKMDTSHLSVKHLPERWTRVDEIYNYVEVPSNVKVVLGVDEATYSGGTHGANHPVSWYREYYGGRSFFTAMGHTVETYQDTLFLEHILQGVRWAGKEY
jgi:type 1 glutamine amidotransferase